MSSLTEEHVPLYMGQVILLYLSAMVAQPVRQGLPAANTSHSLQGCTRIHIPYTVHHQAPPQRFLSQPLFCLSEGCAWQPLCILWSHLVAFSSSMTPPPHTKIAAHPTTGSSGSFEGRVKHACTCCQRMHFTQHDSMQWSHTSRDRPAVAASSAICTASSSGGKPARAASAQDEKVVDAFDTSSS